MELGTVAGKLAASAALSAVRRLAAPAVRETLVSRILEGIDASVYRITANERKGLSAFVSRDDVWPYLIEPSLEVSPEFVEKIERQVFGERRQEDGRRSLAEQIANLSRSELPGALGAELTFNILSNQIRDASDRQLRRQDAILAQLREQGSSLQATSEADLAEYRRLLIGALSSRAPNRLYDCTYIDHGESQPVSALVNSVRETRWAVLQAPAGYGKTAILTTLALEVSKIVDLLVVYLDLKPWATVSGNVEEITIESLLRFSTIAIDVATVERLSSLESGVSRVIWLVDGINELPSSLSARVVDLLAAYMRPRLRFSMVVADRSATRYGAPDWTVLHLQLLSEDEVLRQLTARDLSFAEPHQILRIPFFLKMAISTRDPSFMEPTRVLEEWFGATLKVQPADLDLLSRLAYEAYGAGIGLSFGSDQLLNAVGEDLAVGLVDADTVRLSADGSAHFFHQLVHDFLAARELACRPEEWGAVAFDSVSFGGNSYDCLLMALDLVESEEAGDRYLISLYDWNWFATVRVLGSSEPAQRRQFSDSVVLAIFALLAEKRLDAVEGSRLRAVEAASKIDESRQLGLANLDNMADIARLVQSFEVANPPDWFVRWRHLFHRLIPNMEEVESATSDSSDSLSVLDRNSIVGWTAAMLLRRGRVGEDVRSHLRTIYRTARTVESSSLDTVRWRVVHALGAYPDIESVELLLEAVTDDPYMWARYGAMRSLIEIAACAPLDTRRWLLAEVGKSLHLISAEPLTQLAWASRYDMAPSGWAEQIRPMLKRVLDIQTDSEARRRWQQRIDAFETWASQRVTY